MRRIISIHLVTIFLLILNLYGQFVEEHMEMLNRQDLNEYNSKISSPEINLSQKYLFKKKSILNQISSVKYYPQYITIENTTRHYFQYDNNGNLIEKLIQTGQAGNWKSSEKYTYSYDSSGNMLSLVKATWNGVWQNSERIIRTYDDNGRILSSTSQLWTGQWNNDQRETYIYIIEENILTQILLIEYDDGNGWFKSNLWTYTYDSNGNRLSYLRETRSNNTWKFEQRYSYTYDSLGNNIFRMAEFGTPLQVWTSSYTYDNNGNVLMELGQELYDSLWVNAFRRSYIYDDNKNLLQMNHNRWDNEDWVNYFRWTYTNDIAGNRITELYESFNSSNNQWNNHNKYIFEYDSNGNATMGKHYHWEGNQWLADINSLVLTYNYRTGFIGFNAAIVEASYILITSLKNISPSVSFLLYQNFPNPFNESTTIKYTLPIRSHVKLVVFDILGRTISTPVNEQKSAGTHSIEFNANGLSSGIYYYRLQTNGFFQIKKLIYLK